MNKLLKQNVIKIKGILTNIQFKGMNAILKRSFEQLQNDGTRTKFIFDTDTLLKDMQLDYKMGKKSKIEMIYKPLDELSVKKFVLGTEKKIDQIIFMQEFEITDETVTIIFSNYIREKLKIMNNTLIIDDFIISKSFKSAYAERLYKQIQMWKDKEELILSIKDFRDFLGVPNSKTYNLMSKLKIKVLKVAIKEINEKSNFKLDYEDIKKGKSITHFRFFWLYNDPAKYEKIQVKKWENTVKRYVGKYIDLYKAVRVQNYNGECNSKGKITKYEMYEYDEEFATKIFVEGYDCDFNKWIKFSDIRSIKDLIMT